MYLHIFCALTHHARGTVRHGSNWQNNTEQGCFGSRHLLRKESFLVQIKLLWETLQTYSISPAPHSPGDTVLMYLTLFIPTSSLKGPGRHIYHSKTCNNNLTKVFWLFHICKMLWLKGLLNALMLNVRVINIKYIYKINFKALVSIEILTLHSGIIVDFERCYYNIIENGLWVWIKFVWDLLNH